MTIFFFRWTIHFKVHRKWLLNERKGLADIPKRLLQDLVIILLKWQMSFNLRGKKEEFCGKQWDDLDRSYSPTTMRVNSKPLFTDFLYTWLGRFANPTYPSRFFCCCRQKPNTVNGFVMLVWQNTTNKKHVGGHLWLHMITVNKMNLQKHLNNSIEI